MNPISISTRWWLLAVCAACSALLLYSGTGRTQTPSAQLEDLAAFPQTTLTITAKGQVTLRKDLLNLLLSDESVY